MKTNSGGPDQTRGTQSLHRALELLHIITTLHPEGALISDIADAAGLARSTTSRILAALTSKGYIRRDRDHCYRLGIEAMRLGIAAMKDAPLIEKCRLIMRSLARQTEDTVFLVVPNADYGQCLHIEHGSFPIKAITSLVGDVRLLGLGTAGQAILALRDTGEIKQLYERHSGAFGSRGLSLDSLLSALQRTRRNGYSSTHNLNTPGVSGVGIAFSVFLD